MSDLVSDFIRDAEEADNERQRRYSMTTPPETVRSITCADETEGTIDERDSGPPMPP